MRILVTGAAGFIGYHLSLLLLKQGHDLVGVDAFTNYYSPDLKRRRLEEISRSVVSPLKFVELDLSAPTSLEDAQLGEFDAIIHLAAQPGVRLLRTQFNLYLQNNLCATGNVFDFAQRIQSEYVLYASSSSVYGEAAALPFRESEKSLQPKSLYGATKLATEILAQGYAISTGLRVRGLRFFTVYGPFGRPDMAYFRLAAAALKTWDFELTGDGSVQRDFTYVDDTVNSVSLLLDDLLIKPEGFHDVVNVGGGQSRSMRELIAITESVTQSDFKIRTLDSFPADLSTTEADFSYLESITKQRPRITLEDGISRLLEWASLPEFRPHLRSWITGGKDG
jgi:UDP-glucuronate 4-epimerase